MFVFQRYIPDSYEVIEACYNKAMAKDLTPTIFRIIQTEGPISVRAIQSTLRAVYGTNADTEEINSLLYGELHDKLIRDKDEAGYPLWRIKVGTFEAAKGLEVMFCLELLQKNVIRKDEAYLGHKIHNRRNGKTYDLDLAIIKNDLKLDIEIDGFEHIRADARLSIQEQIEKRGEKTEIDIDWMDNSSSFTDFKLIDNKRLFRWLATHRDWAKRYHEELLKPHDITRNIWLIESGWKVMRFWNFEVKEEMKRCLDDVKSFLE